MSSIGKLMKQAAKMQADIEATQRELRNRTVESSSGGGAVKVVARCDGTIASLKLDPAAVNPADVQLLEDMLITALNQALTEARDLQQQELGKVTQGINLPGFV